MSFPCYRGHKAHHGPVYFNRSKGRFAAPDGAAFGTLYLGGDEFCAFMEAFHHHIQDGILGRYVSESLLGASCLCTMTVTRPLQLVDLTTGPAIKHLSIHADNRICDGPHPTSQRWALALWSHPQRPDGLLYRSRHSPERTAIAVFDRAAPVLVAGCAVNLLRDAARVATILDHYECALIP